MLFHTGLSSDSDLETALRDASERARSKFGDAPIDLCIVFASPAYGSLDAVPALLLELTGARVLCGCSGGGIIGEGDEIEGRHAVSVTLASLPGVEVVACHLSDADLPDPDAPPAAWTGLVGVDPSAAKGLVVLPEPFSFSADRLLDGLDYAYEGVPKIGGIASGGQQPLENSLFLGTDCFHAGAVILAFSGAIEVDTIVAQGCRPFGKTGRITRCDEHRLIAIDGMPAAAFLQQELKGVDAAELEIAKTSPMFLGIAMDPFKVDAPSHGEFLIRNIIGVDAEIGAIVVGQRLQNGRLVQFHLRDRGSSVEDLRAVLGRHPGDVAPGGALLFSCLGRGEHLYGESGHDSRVFRELIGEVPLAGFFCNGEIGPVGGKTYLHGYTSSFGLLRGG